MKAGTIARKAATAATTGSLSGRSTTTRSIRTRTGTTLRSVPAAGVGAVARKAGAMATTGSLGGRIRPGPATRASTLGRAGTAAKKAGSALFAKTAARTTGVASRTGPFVGKGQPGIAKRTGPFVGKGQPGIAKRTGPFVGKGQPGLGSRPGPFLGGRRHPAAMTGRGIATRAGALAVLGAVLRSLGKAARTSTAGRKPGTTAHGHGTAHRRRPKLPVALLGMAAAVLLWRELPAIKRYYTMSRM